MKKSSETDRIPLQWVGMEKIMLPVRWSQNGVQTMISAEFNIFVDLVNPSKGIHMSRLYELLMRFAQAEELSIAGLKGLLMPLVQSQKGLSHQAQIGVSFSLPIQVKTLKSQRSYFKTVPVQFKFFNDRAELSFSLEYSSTCPQSAALAHQLTILELEKQNKSLGLDLINWYNERGLIATPHAQRSHLELTVGLADGFEINQFADFFTQLEQCLGTPTQGLVKRDDEQEFAKLNAQNLMFCEDAARKVVVFLEQCPHVKTGHGKVSHLESLHSHNAVAYFHL